VDRVGGERPGQVLVHAHGDADVVLARADGLGRELERRGRGGAAVVDIHELDAGEPEQPDHGVGVVDLGAAAERELHVLPLDPGVGAGGPHRLGAHLDGGLGPEPPERVDPDPDDRNAVHVSPY
jgi:hypothetical protein